MFCHSLVSDWNHGNAHFLRGIASELLARGHGVTVLEPRNSWSRRHLLEECGDSAISRFERAYPTLHSITYGPHPDLDRVLGGADLVLVHEWTDPTLVAAIGEHRAAGGHYRLLFHDTHHRSLTAPQEMAAYDLSHYDGVLAFGEVIRRRYLDQGWAERAWTWHEAADHRVFRPLGGQRLEGDLVWVGNWGDDERSAELEEFVIEPSRALELRTRMYGVRYPAAAVERLARVGIDYGGWMANFAVPGVFARFRVTVHVPRRPYVEALPGIPTIRVFEALACGIPLICAPWEDSEGLFRPGHDFLQVSDGRQMTRALREVIRDRALAATLRERGLAAIEARHTCGHRVDELLAIHASLTTTRAEVAG
jgi:spore maturation protein CgeB